MGRVCRAATLVAAGLVCSSSATAQQASIDSLRATVRALQTRVDSLEARPAAASTAQAAAPVRTTGAYMNTSFVGLTDGGWSTEKNVRTIEVGDHDPHVRGFTIPNAELALDGAVDPYFKGFANIVYKLDNLGETGVELEEMYFLTTSLPHNFQLKGGQFFAEFGRQNPQHPHSWAFADEPLVLNRMFGAEGLRSQGLRLSWLAPTSFYTEASVGVFNSAGGTAWSFRSDESEEISGRLPVERPVLGGGELLYVPRLSSSFDITDDQTIVVGVSGAFGPNNTGPSARTSIVGADLYWKWKSATARQGFPFVSFQTEAMARRYDAAAGPAFADNSVSLPNEDLKDQGAYFQVLWGIKPLLVAGMRAEYVTGDSAALITDARANRSRYSPNVTWYPTEFSKFRLQYNFDHRVGIGNDHSLWFQIEFLLGAHAAHKF